MKGRSGSKRETDLLIYLFIHAYSGMHRKLTN